MPSAQIVNFQSSGINDNVTNRISLTGNHSLSAAAANKEIPIRDAGTFRNLFVFVSTNTTVTVSSTFTLQKSAADTAVLVTYAAAETGVKEDTSNSVAFANTDEACYQIVVPSEAGTTTITVFSSSIEFNADASCVTFLTQTGGQSAAFDNTTRYWAPLGDFSAAGETNENNVPWRARAAFDISDFYISVATNARTTNTVFTTRKNAGAGAQSLTYGSVETGVKEDSSNTDSLAIDDTFNYSITTGVGTETMSVRVMNTSCISASRVFPFMNTRTGAAPVAFNNTVFGGMSGNLTSFTATEANAQILPRFNFTARELGAVVSSNTIGTSATTVTLRDNGADGALTLSYAAAESGVKFDSVNSDVITAGVDEINYKVVTPNTSGTIRFVWITALGSTTALASNYRTLLGVGI